MITKKLLTICSLFSLGGPLNLKAEESIPENFKKEQLVAWCIVPFDAKKRSPAERVKMLQDLGLRRSAYDWRKEHIPQFEEEILAYKEGGIEFFAFWNVHESAFALFKKHKIRPQIWKTLPSPKAESQEDRVAAAIKLMTPLAAQTKEMGCKLGLYNHGGWGGEPENMVAVCQALRKDGFDNVGIVYNFHHGHDRISDFPESMTKLKPYLLCLNLNGMTDAETVKAGSGKILAIGEGKHEAAMIEQVVKSGYSGPIGILDHINSQDAELSLRKNLEGLKKILRHE